VSGMACDAATVTVSPARVDLHGVRVHTVQSPYQVGTTTIRVLLPDNRASNERFSVLYVLPVEAHGEHRYGDGLTECKQHDLHNRYHLICVAPTFSDLPWYADHPSNLRLRQERYLLQVVLPFVDRTYPVTDRSNRRLLVGFSKSGWGAFSLLLRHPDLFAKAAAWDAPLMMHHPDRYGMQPIFGTEENFRRYQITRLLRSHAETLHGPPRLIVTGYGNFRQHHQEVHALLTELGIPHVYRDGPQRDHRWDSGWLAEAVRLLVRRRKQGENQQGRENRRPQLKSHEHQGHELNSPLIFWPSVLSCPSCFRRHRVLALEERARRHESLSNRADFHDGLH